MRFLTLSLTSALLLTLGMPGTGMGGPRSMLARRTAALLAQEAPPDPKETLFRHTRLSEGTRAFAKPVMKDGQPTFSGDGTEFDDSKTVFAVDSKDVVHAVRLVHEIDPDTNREKFSLVYRNTDPATAQVDGFSPRQVLREVFYQSREDAVLGQSGHIFTPEIVVDGSDVVHLVWIEDVAAHPFTDATHIGYPASSLVHSHRLFHRSCSGGVWSGTAMITPDFPVGYGTDPIPAPSISAGAVWSFYNGFQLKVGADGQVYIAALLNVLFQTFIPPLPGLHDDPIYSSKSVTYYLFGNTGGSWQRVEAMIGNPVYVYDQSHRYIADYYYDLVVRELYDFAVSPAGEPIFFWRDFFNDIVYSSNLSVASRKRYDDPVSKNFTALYDRRGELHLGWNAGTKNTLNAYYRDGLTGPIQLLPASNPGYLAYLQLDARDQLHFFAGTSSLAVFSRLRDPSTGALSPVFKSTAALSLSGSVDESRVYITQNFFESDLNVQFTLLWRRLVVSPAGTIHGLHTGLTESLIDRRGRRILRASDMLCRSLEPGLGMLNPAAMVPMFPGGKVNALNGNLHARINLFSTSGVGPCQSLSLLYNSLQDREGSVGAGWTLSTETYLIDHRSAYRKERSFDNTIETPTNGDHITLVLSDGRRFHFGYREDQGVHSGGGGGLVGSLERVGFLTPEYKLTNPHGTVFWFNTSGMLRRVEEATGNYIEFFYSGRNLTGIRDMNGQRSTTLSYSGSRVSSVVDPAGGTYTFAYTGNLLESVTFASGSGSPKYGFEYAAQDLQPVGSRRLMSRFKTPRAQAGGYGWDCTYHPNGRFRQVQDPSEAYLLEGAGDEAPATSQRAVQSIRYLAFVVSGLGGLVTDRRGFHYRYDGFEGSTGAGISDEAVLAPTEVDPFTGVSLTGLSRTSIGYDLNGYPTGMGDRWGGQTSVTYDDEGTLLFMDKPAGDGPFPDRVLRTTLTEDGFKRVKTSTRFVTPPGSTEVQARITTYDYNSVGQLVQVTYPDVTLPDGTTQQGVTSRYEYNGPRRAISRVIDEEGHVTDYFDFDPLTGLARSVLRQGGTQPITMTYDVMGNLVEKRLPRGGPENEMPGPATTVLDGMYRVQSQIDPAGKVTNYQYDLDSNVVRVVPPAGGESTTAFDRRGFVSGGSSPDGAWSQLVDANGNIRRAMDLRGFASSFRYDYLNRPTSSKVPGASTLPGGEGGGGEVQTTLTEYDLLDETGSFERSTNVGAVSRSTRRYFDARRRVRLVISPDNLTKSETFFDEQDYVVATQQVNGTTIQSCMVTFRDERNRTVHSRTQNTDFRAPVLDQHTDSYTIYNKAGAVMVQVDPLGDVTQGGTAHKTTYLRDVRGRVDSVIDGKGVVVAQYLYGDDDLVREVRVPDPASKSATLVTASARTYTARKEVLSERDFLGSGNVYSYATLPGQLSTVTDPAGSVTRMTYDPLTQHVDTVTEAEGTPSQNQTKQVWENGFLTQTKVWNPQSNGYDATFTRTYDQAGRLERTESPPVTQGRPMAPERYFYNSFGEASMAVAGSKVVRNSYDLLGRNTESTWHGAYSAGITRTYNAAGQIETISDGALSKTMLYEAWRGTPHTESIAVGGQPWVVQNHQYDQAGNNTGFVDGEANPHSWPVDENNRPTEIRYQNKSSKSITYTPGGQVDREVVRDASGAEIASTVHAYDRLGRRIESQTVQSGTGEVLTHYGWEYDSRHLINAIHVRHLGASFSFGLDAKGRPVTESTPGNNGGQNAPPFENEYGGDPTGNGSPDSTEASASSRAALAVPARSASYAFGPSGNRMSATIDGVVTTYEYNAANQLLSERSAVKRVDHEYDEWGNEVTRTTTLAPTPENPNPTPTIERYGYNHLNRLSSYTNTATGANWQYDYYPTGERYSKTDLTNDSSELYVSKFGDVATEYTKLGNSAPILKNSYIQGLGTDAKETRVASNGTRRHYLSDQVGTLGMTLDDAGGAVDSSVKDAWGVSVAGGSSERYSGVAQREVDTESGLVYMRHRMYDPALGRFVQDEPIRSRRAFAGYKYADNYPTIARDPSGRFPFLIIAAVVAAFLIAAEHLDEGPKYDKQEVGTAFGLMGGAAVPGGWAGKWAVRGLESIAPFLAREGLAKGFTTIFAKLVGNAVEGAVTNVAGETSGKLASEGRLLSLDEFVDSAESGAAFGTVAGAAFEGLLFTKNKLFLVFKKAGSKKGVLAEIDLAMNPSSKTVELKPTRTIEASEAEMARLRQLELEQSQAMDAAFEAQFRDVPADAETVLYQKVNAEGDHLKFGLAKNEYKASGDLTRYTADELDGGRCVILQYGSKEDICKLERYLHKNMPLGPEERQAVYFRIQAKPGGYLDKGPQSWSDFEKGKSPKKK